MALVTLTMPAKPIDRVNTVNRSVSFNLELFERMEKRRSNLMMERSEYIKNCVLKDMIAGGVMSVQEVPHSLIANPTPKRKATKKSK